MKYSIQSKGDHLHAELQNRESAADMRAFLVAVKQACREHGQPKVLLYVRDSRAVFKAEDYGLSGEVRGYLSELVTPGCRVALVGDSSELHHAHDYIVLVARQQGINARAFREARSAREWLRLPDDQAPAPRAEASEPATAARRR